MSLFFSKLGALVGGVLIVAGSWVSGVHVSAPNTLGAANSFTPVQVQKTYLSGAGISASSNSIVLTSLKLSDGVTNVLMTNFGSIGYATLDPGVPKKEENVSFTGITQNAIGTATLTGVARGLLPVSPYTSSSSLMYAHSGGSAVVFSNSAPFYSQFAIANNTSTINANWTFGSSTLPKVSSDTTDAQVSATTNTLATVNYVNNVATSGAPNASQSVKGVIQFSSTAQVSSGTATGSTGATLAPQTSDFGASSTARQMVPVTNSLGKLSQVFFDLTQEFSFTGGLRSSSSTFTSSTFIGTVTLPAGNPVNGTDATNKTYVDSATTKMTLNGLTTSTAGGVGTTSTIRTVTIPALGVRDELDIDFEAESNTNLTTFNLFLVSGGATSTLWNYLDGAQHTFHGTIKIFNRNSTSSQYFYTQVNNGSATSTITFSSGTPSLPMDSTTSTLVLTGVNPSGATLTSNFLNFRKILSN